MRITISCDGAKSDLGTGFGLLGSLGAMLLPLFIVIDSLSGKLTWVLPSLIVACAFGAVLNGVLNSRPLTAAATFLGGLSVGALVLSLTFIFAIFNAGIAAPKPILLEVVWSSLGGLALLLIVSLRLKYLAQRRGEVV
jgi:hypothetical protein